MKQTEMIVSKLDELIAWIEGMSPQEWEDWMASTQGEDAVEWFMKTERWLDTISRTLHKGDD
jgi:hypothetical protein